ncbi:hypothetical protein BpHYR1_018717 [Brachionus plicatilis]|uniref:Uncharacterized protein n=1 Tax=Brachionus plicatilis TaxID=10195 RepID=A0A3M7Q255_BRAPC|nr:hypothetical protein BpHYR1_018717 [Brachionus plicatilis]
MLTLNYSLPLIDRLVDEYNRGFTSRFLFKSHKSLVTWDVLQEPDLAKSGPFFLGLLNNFAYTIYVHR